MVKHLNWHPPRLARPRGCIGGAWTSRRMIAGMTEHIKNLSTLLWIWMACQLFALLSSFYLYLVLVCGFLALICCTLSVVFYVTNLNPMAQGA